MCANSVRASLSGVSLLGDGSCGAIGDANRIYPPPVKNLPLAAQAKSSRKGTARCDLRHGATTAPAPADARARAPAARTSAGHHHDAGPRNAAPGRTRRCSRARAHADGGRSASPCDAAWAERARRRPGSARSPHGKARASAPPWLAERVRRRLRGRECLANGLARTPERAGESP